MSDKESRRGSNGGRSSSSAGAFLKKYFWEGQKLSQEQVDAAENLPPDADWTQVLLVKHRRLVGILIPPIFFEVCWWCLAVKWDFFSLFEERWEMTLTMVFGAMIAGMTSEGGGAVAFPVMTLVLGIDATIARDFSLLVQSCGMSAAAFTIFWMKIKIEWHSIVFCGFGATFGIIFGLEVIDELLSGDDKKLIFVSVWFSFAFTLYLMNRNHHRRTFDAIPNFGYWQAAVLVITGFIGGGFTSIAGSGVDICSFSILSLFFRVNEKVSTPTSVVLMAMNSLVGVFWRQLMTDGGAEEEAWLYLAVCVPVVVFCAPFGSFLSSHFHRLVLAFLVIALDTAALVSALALIEMTWQRWVMVTGILLGGLLVFLVISYLGQRLLKKIEREEKLTGLPAK